MTDIGPIGSYGPITTGESQLDLLVDQVCERARFVRGDVHEVVGAEIDRVAPLADRDVRAELTSRAVARLSGLDVVQCLLDDPSVDEVMVNHGREVWVERNGALGRVTSLGDGAIDAALERVLAPLGRRLDRSSPIVDARLPDGSRLCAVVAPVAVDGTTVSIRRHRRSRFDLADFATPPVAALLAEVIDARCNVLIAGATSSGKTSLLAAILDLVPTSERLVVIEDTTELPLRDRHAVRLETRTATADGPGAIGVDALVRTALRLRPDRLVLGEFRGAEAAAVVEALNTGHDGSFATCHANSPSDGLRRVETLVVQAAPSWPMAAVRRQVSRSIDVVVHVRRDAHGARTVSEVAEVVESGGEPEVRLLATRSARHGDLERRRT